MDHRIVVGPDVSNPLCVFDTKDIYSLSMVTGVDVVGTELTVDQLVPKVYYPYGEDFVEFLAPADGNRLISSDGFVIATNRSGVNPRLFAYGTVMRYYRDGQLVAKMYVKSVDRIAKYIYKINAMSAVGLMDTQKHYGNLYRGIPFEDVVSEIIGGAVDFTVAEDVKSLKVYGWLPYDTKRANLHQLLFANGVMCGKDENGDILFKFISDKAPVSIPRDRIYYGGSVDYPAFASAVEVTEHSFFALPTDEVVTVYDNTDGSETANHTFIAFRDAPLHDLATTDTLVIESSGVNWAIVTGTGVLTGKKYTHSTQIVRRVADNAGSQKENVATVSDAYLVNVTNSYNVAKRVLAYYNARKVVTASIVEDREKCGDLITGFDPYDEPISGFIATMQSEISGITKAQCEIITDYVPTGQGGNYTRYVLLTGSGTWRIPQEVFDKEDPIIQATLISGGHGGFKGADGETVEDPWDSVGPATKGGEGGNPGDGGKVVTITLDCTGKTSFDFACGAGGESDQPGGDTLFGEFSSSSGIPTAHGVENVFTGEVYGTAGVEKGVAGGRGQSSSEPEEIVTYKGQSWHQGERGENAIDGDLQAIAGGGGGAAVGSNGGKSASGELSTNSNGTVSAYGGAGGKGADALPGDDATVFGCGGNGGHGGGGGGQGGSASGSTAGHSWQGGSGQPGTGGLGGRGGPGVVVIYY